MFLRPETKGMKKRKRVTVSNQNKTTRRVYEYIQNLKTQNQILKLQSQQLPNYQLPNTWRPQHHRPY